MVKYRFTPTAKSTLFDHLKPYRFVLVSGPHRAGTTIASAMITNDLGYEWVEDSHDQLQALLETYQDMKPTVFHCPTFCHTIHEYAQIPDIAAVIVMRDAADIEASQKRIPWGFEGEQLNYYRFKADPRPAFGVCPPIATVKYRYWQEVQKPLFGDAAFELDYEALSAHPMWVVPERRRGFTANQIEIGNPHGPKIQGRRPL